MVIDPVRIGQRFELYRDNFTVSEVRVPLSTITSIAEGRAVTKPYRFYVWLSKRWNQFLFWLKNLFQRKEKKKAEIPIYFRVFDAEKGSNKYRLLKNGKSTQNYVSMGQKIVQLGSISFGDGKQISALPKMVRQIMRDEKIDAIQTKNLPAALHLWKCGLRTDSKLSYTAGKSPLDTYVGKVIKEAMSRRASLDDLCLDALERIEKHLIIAILSESFLKEQDQREEYIESQVAGLFHLFPDIHYIEAVNQMVREAESGAMQTAMEIFKSISPSSLSGAGGRVSFSADFRIEDLFILSKALSVKIGQHVNIPQNPIVFTKENP